MYWYGSMLIFFLRRKIFSPFLSPKLSFIWTDMPLQLTLPKSSWDHGVLQCFIGRRWKWLYRVSTAKLDCTRQANLVIRRLVTSYCLTLVSPRHHCPLGSSGPELPSRLIPAAISETEPHIWLVWSCSEATGVSKAIGWLSWCIKALQWRTGR